MSEKRRFRIEKPSRVLYLDQFFIWCPKCESVDFTHEHDVKLIGTPANIPTPAEHNWMLKNLPLYSYAKLGMLPESTVLGFPGIAPSETKET